MTSNPRATSLLALNVGSASVKAARYEWNAARRMYMELARTSLPVHHDHADGSWDWAEEQLNELASEIWDVSGEGPRAVVHRIVHGGERSSATRLTPSELRELETLAPLAPIHQPPALALVGATAARWRSAEQFGAFDTTWHQTMPEMHRLLAVPYRLQSQGVRRYGFHGLAFQSGMRLLKQSDPAYASARVVLAHLGGGASLCAVRDGHCVSTTMGMTPLDGIPMGSRPGALDPGVVVFLQKGLGMSLDEVEHLLWRECGLKGLSGETGDVQALLASSAAGAKRALDVYVTRIAQGIAQMAVCLGGIDVLGFSGGVGLHAARIRSRIVDQLDWMGVQIDERLNDGAFGDLSATSSGVRIYALAIDEEQEMARGVAEQLAL